MKSTVSRILVGLFSVGVASPAFAQVSNFDSLNGYASGIEARVAQARNKLVQFDPEDSQSSHLVFTGGYIDRKIDNASDSFKRSADGQSGLLGYNWKNGQWNLGGGIGIDYIKSDYVELKSPAPIPLHGSVKAHTTEGVVWAGVNTGALRFAAFGSVSGTSNKGTRVSDTGSSRADYDSKGSALGLQVSYTVSLSESVALLPFVGISTASADSDGFTEQGTAPDRRILKDFSVQETQGAVGVRVTGKQGNWIPSASVAWLDRFSGGDTTIGNSAINGSNLGSGVSPAPSSGLLYFSAGINGKLAERWTAGAEAQYFTGGDERQLGLNISLRRSF